MEPHEEQSQRRRGGDCQGFGRTICGAPAEGRLRVRERYGVAEGIRRTFSL